MKTKDLLSLLLLFCLLGGCEKEDIDYRYSGFQAYSPSLVVGNNRIEIKMQKIIMYLCGTTAPGEPVFKVKTPDYCDLYMANQPDGPYIKVYTATNLDKEDHSYTVDAINGKEYYFYVISYREKYDPITSETTMAISNPRLKMNTLISVLKNDFRVDRFSISPLANKIAYENSSYQLENGTRIQAILIANLDGTGTELIGVTYKNPCWDKKGENLYFCTGAQDGQGPAQQLSIFNYKTKEVTKLIKTKSAPFCNYSACLFFFK